MLGLEGRELVGSCGALAVAGEDGFGADVGPTDRSPTGDPPRDRNSEQFLLLYQRTGDSQYASADRFMSCSGATLEVMRHSVLSTTPTAEKPALSDEERAERRRRLAERVFSPGGLDRDTLEHIEQLTDNES